MKTVFIVNSHAGKGNDAARIIRRIKDAIDEKAATYITRSVGDATTFVKNYCAANGAARFIACGGDGTLNEVLNGMIDIPCAQVGVIPMGTGNDFCRNFGQDTDFSDIKLQTMCNTIKCDAIKFAAHTDNGIKNGYCINMINIGFDCNVADMTADMKKKPFVSGSMAYFLSILVNLIKKRGADIDIFLDGKKTHSGKLLLASIANGCFCGGGIKSNPVALVNDGLININIIRNVSRIRFISLLPHYMKGTHLKIRGIEKIITSQKHRHIKIVPATGNMRICVDGEIFSVHQVEFEIVPGAVDFAVPYTRNKAGAVEKSGAVL